MMRKRVSDIWSTSKKKKTFNKKLWWFEDTEISGNVIDKGDEFD